MRNFRTAEHSRQGWGWLVKWDDFLLHNTTSFKKKKATVRVLR